MNQAVYNLENGPIPSFFIEEGLSDQLESSYQRGESEESKEIQNYLMEMPTKPSLLQNNLVTDKLNEVLSDCVHIEYFNNTNEI